MSMWSVHQNQQPPLISKGEQGWQDPSSDSWIGKHFQILLCQEQEDSSAVLSWWRIRIRKKLTYVCRILKPKFSFPLPYLCNFEEEKNFYRNICAMAFWEKVYANDNFKASKVKLEPLEKLQSTNSFKTLLFDQSSRHGGGRRPGRRHGRRSQVTEVPSKGKTNWDQSRKYELIPGSDGVESLQEPHTCDFEQLIFFYSHFPTTRFACLTKRTHSGKIRK